jgi:hypothetical protein
MRECVSVGRSMCPRRRSCSPAYALPAADCGPAVRKSPGQHSSGPVGRVGLRSVRRGDNAEFVCSGRPRLAARGGKKVATLAAAETREFPRVEVRHHEPTSSRLKRRGQLCNRSGTGRPLNEVPGEASGGGSLWAQGVYRRRESIAAGSLIDGTMALVNRKQRAENGTQIAERLDWLARSPAAFSSFQERYPPAARTGERE